MTNSEYQALTKSFASWLEDYDEKQAENPRSYISPRTGLKDCYQARFDDMLEAALDFGYKQGLAKAKEGIQP